MRMDSSIIMAGRPVSALTEIQRGIQTASLANQVQQQNALSSLFREQGPQIAAGEQGALNALARFDPTASLGITGTRLGHDSTRLGMDATRLGMSATRLNMAGQRTQNALSALALDRAQSRISDGDFATAMGWSESGGNFGARNDEGYVGRVQAGQARLDDFSRSLGIGRISTEQFRNDPNLQENFERWHFNDLSAAADELAPYYGQTIGGVPINRESLMAMAHLGGKGGMKKFVQTGGRYNPADSNGTKLSDYGQRFVGTRFNANGGPSQKHLLALLAQTDPNTDPGRIAAINDALEAMNPEPVKGIVVGGVLRNPHTGEIMGDYASQPAYEVEDGYFYDPANPAAGARRVPGLPEGSAGSEAEREIARLMSIGIPRDVAIRIKEGVYKEVTDPVTREVTVIDLSSGQPVFNASEQVQGNGTPQGDPAMGQGTPSDQSTPATPMSETNGLTFGPRFQNSPDSFGIEGTAKRAVNSAADVAGFSTPYPDVQDTQRDYDVLRESLLNRIAGAYNRQPPSWLLQSIQENLPRAGSPMEGPGTAQSKLRALGRDLSAEREILRSRLGHRLKPDTRGEVQSQLTAVEQGLAQIGDALGSFGGAAEGTTPGGIRFRVIE